MRRPNKPPIQPLDISEPLRRTLMGIGANMALAVVKIVTGIVGNSWALIADGIESVADVFSSFVVFFGLRFSVRPPDEKHPYGHGKAETLAGMLTSSALLLSAGIIAWQSIEEIWNPLGEAPSWFTLPVLVAVIVVKIVLSRALNETGTRHGSSALQIDAFHHLSDAITSGAACIGIAVALIGGPGWESADDWAALLACSVIVWNGVTLFRGSLDEIMDSAVPPNTEENIRRISGAVAGVLGIEKCRVRKSGLGLIMDIHVEVDGNLTVTRGHDIATDVKKALLDSELGIMDVTVHIEPFPEQVKTGPTDGRTH